MNLSVTKRRTNKRSKNQYRLFEQLFTNDSRVNVAALIQFKNELDLEVIEVISHHPLRTRA